MVCDYLGRPIQVGDIICYPGRTGSSMWLNHAVVKSIDKHTHKQNDIYTLTIVRFNMRSRKTSIQGLTRIDRVVVIKDVSVLETNARRKKSVQSLIEVQKDIRSENTK